jgi:hypothetical protein
MPRNFLPQNQKMMPVPQNRRVSAMLTKIGARKPDSAAQGVKNLLAFNVSIFPVYSSIVGGELTLHRSPIRFC